MKKDTDDLLHEIKTTVSIENYLTENSDEHMNIDLAQYLNQLLLEKNFERKQVYTKGNIAKSYGDHILNSRREKPSRNIVLQFCLGLELSIDESQRLLRIARLGSLYARDKRDSVIMFCLQNKKTAVECDLLLDELNQTILTN